MAFTSDSYDAFLSLCYYIEMFFMRGIPQKLDFTRIYVI